MSQQNQRLHVRHVADYPRVAFDVYGLEAAACVWYFRGGIGRRKRRMEGEKGGAAVQGGVRPRPRSVGGISGIRATYSSVEWWTTATATGAPSRSEEINGE